MFFVSQTDDNRSDTEEEDDIDVDAAGDHDHLPDHDKEDEAAKDSRPPATPTKRPIHSNGRASANKVK